MPLPELGRWPAALAALAALPRRLVRAWWPAEVADEALAGPMRARQLHAVLRLTPMAMAANLLNVIVLAVAFAQTPQLGFVLAWAIGVLAISFKGLLGWWHSRRRGAAGRASPRALRRATVQASVLAAFWAVVPLVLFPRGTPEQQLLVATVTTGMMCAGGFALATVPAAGTAYVVVLGLGNAVTLLLSDLRLAGLLSLLLFIYGAVVVASVWSTARTFNGRMLAEAEAERQNELIGLLLRDFEENASDLLWEVDIDGCLRHVSARMEALFGLDAAALAEGTIFEHLRRITPDDEVARRRLRELRQRFVAGAPFRDLPLAGTVDGATRWWSVSAKPLLDEQGRCRGWRGVAADITEVQLAHNQLSWLAHNDTLTGLANRHQLRNGLQELLSAHGRNAMHVAVLCLDLDHFKVINDTLGHAVGDALLQEVGRRLQAVTRRSDMAARMGGDEFALVLRDVAGADEVLHFAQRLLAALEEPCTVHDKQLVVRSSIGVALGPRDGQDVDTLLNHADIALYAAKAAGRNEVRFYVAEMAASARRRLAIEQGLREALARGELRLVFQPQARLGDWRITGFEALLRWRHPELGELAPTEFIPVAEESGQMTAIGEWVLREACRHAVAWPAALTVAVNVSPMQVHSHGFVDQVLQAARNAGLAPERLEVEITESAFLHEGHDTADALHALRRAGVRIALDDFGTGYSALSYLRRFPFHTLKIDRSFVREVLTRSDARAIVKTIIGLARTLKMTTVAEGVEEPAHAAALARWGCHSMQGYLIARPVAADAVPGLLAGWRPQPLPPAEPVATEPVPLPV